MSKVSIGADRFDLRSSRFRITLLAEILFCSTRYHLEWNTGGKPSTWFPPGRLVEQNNAYTYAKWYLNLMLYILDDFIMISKNFQFLSIFETILKTSDRIADFFGYSFRSIYIISQQLFWHRFCILWIHKAFYMTRRAEQFFC